MKLHSKIEINRDHKDEVTPKLELKSQILLPQSDLFYLSYSWTWNVCELDNLFGICGYNYIVK